MAAPKVACYQTTQVQTECFQESSCKHCKTAALVEKNVGTFLAWEFEGKVLPFSLLGKKFEISMVDFVKNQCL